MPNDDLPRVFVSSGELGRFLRLTDTSISHLARQGIFERRPHPVRPRAYQYELITSLTRYVEILNDRLRDEQELRRHRRGT
jgi:hypothetical protein